MTKPVASPALSHLRVLDLTRVRAGPTCCRILADFGADVIKIERRPASIPNDGMSGARHGYDMVNLHRNKRSLTLNLKEPEGRDVFMRMVKTADVVVENFRPDVKDRLGIDYESLQGRQSAHHPGVDLGLWPDRPLSNARRLRPDRAGHGRPDGRHRRARHAADARRHRRRRFMRRRFRGDRHSDRARRARERSGLGQWVQTSLLQAQIAMMDFQAARYLVEGNVPPQAGNDHPTSTPMGVRGDRRRLHQHRRRRRRPVARVVQGASERPDLGVRSGLRQGRATARATGRRSRRCSTPIFATRTSAEWLAMLEADGVPAGPIYKVDEVFADPQVQHLGIAVPLNDAERGDVRVVGSRSRCRARPRASSPACRSRASTTQDILGGIRLFRPTKSRSFALERSCDAIMDIKLSGKTRAHHRRLARHRTRHRRSSRG